jgi:ATP-dependent RNA helicase RhlE
MRPGRVLFTELKLIKPLQSALAKAGYTEPTPIQQAAIPPALAGRDVLGCAQTGTGKTAAFSLPILQHVDNTASDDPYIRALILTPTRELAAQIGESLSTYGAELDLWHTVIFGGVNEKPQIQELQRGVDILVATPGRLLDLMNRGFINLSRIEIFVLDEADRMLDMGFIHDVKKVTAVLPKKRQTLFFSATMPDEIRKLADNLLISPEVVSVTPVSSTAERIVQSVSFVDKDNKPKLLVDKLRNPDCQRVLVFSRTKHGANRIVASLEKAKIASAAIHGNKSQGARTRALDGFRDGSVRVLIATDIAARGIDVDGVTHVINYDIPDVPETYVHRIGRTARAGREGVAWSFCEFNDRYYLEDIERLIKINIPRDLEHAYPPTERVPPETNLSSRQHHSPKVVRQQRPAQARGGRPSGHSQHSKPRPGAKPRPRTSARAGN